MITSSNLRALVPFFCALVALGGWLGCGGDDGTPSPTGPAAPYDLKIVVGNNQVGEPGETLEQPLEVQAIDGLGRPLSGVVVRFSVTAGSGALSDTSAMTTTDGRARTHLTLGPSPGVNTVAATAPGLSGLPPTFTAVAEGEAVDGPIGPAGSTQHPDSLHFSLAVEKLNLPGGVLFGLTNRVTAYVFGESSNPVPAGAEVRFHTTGGGIEASVKTDASGSGSVTMTTAGPVPKDGWAVVTARTVGVGDTVLTAQIRVLFSGPTVVRLLQPAGFSVAPGESQAFLFYVGDPVCDSLRCGHPLAEGTHIEVTAEGGTVSGQTDVILPDTQSPEATRFAVLFQAEEGDVIPRMTIDVTSPNGDRTVEFVSGAGGPGVVGPLRIPDSLSVEVADSVLIADGISTTTVTATVRDSAGSGIPNETVSFAASAGGIDATALTDPAGRAVVLYRSVVNPAGVPAVAIQANIGTLSSETALRLLGVRLQLSASPDTVAADGISQSTVTALLTTETDTPVPFVPVLFGATVGALSGNRVETDVTGRASVVYTSVASPSDLAGVEVRARASGLDASAPLGVLGVKLALTASPDTIAADGNAQATIQVELKRSDGVAIPNGLIRFETTLGELSSAVVETDGEGAAQAILVAGTDAGKAVVTATYGDGLREQLSVFFVKGPPTSIILISVTPPSIGVRGTGANETATVVFEVRDDRGNTVADGEPVLFRLDAPGEGDERVGPARTATVRGRVQAAVSSGTLAHTVRLIAEVPLAAGDTVRSTPVPIAVHAGLPDLTHFSISPSPVNLAGRVVYGLQSTVTAYVFDKYSNPVPAGTSVRFRTNGGGIQGSAETDEDGQAFVTLFTAAPIPPEADDYLATIIGQTVDENGREIETSTTVLFSGPTAPIRLIGAGADTISVGKLFIPEDGYQIITFVVSDISGNPVMGGSLITVTSDVGRVSGDSERTIPDARSGNTEYAITVADPIPFEDPPQLPQRGSVLIKVSSFNGDRQLAFSVVVD